MVAMVKKAIPAYKLDEMFYLGTRLTGSQCEEHRIVVKSYPMEELMPAVISFAKSLKKNRRYYLAQKERMNASIIRIIDEEDPVVLDEGRYRYEISFHVCRTQGNKAHKGAGTQARYGGCSGRGCGRPQMARAVRLDKAIFSSWLMDRTRPSTSWDHRWDHGGLPPWQQGMEAYGRFIEAYFSQQYKTVRLPGCQR